MDSKPSIDETADIVERVVQPAHVGQALKTCFKIIKKGYDKSFGYTKYFATCNKHTFHSLSPYWLERGSLNCVTAEPGLSVPLFLRLLLEFRKYSYDSVLVVSNMPTEEAITRLAASISRIDYSRLKDRRICGRDLPNLSRAASELYDSDYYVYYDNGGFSSESLQNLIDCWSDKREPLGLILISSPQLEADEDVFEKLRIFAEKHNLSIILSKMTSPKAYINDDDTPDCSAKINNIFDLSMTLHFVEGFIFEISVEHWSGITGSICNIVFNPASGIFEFLTGE